MKAYLAFAMVLALMGAPLAAAQQPVLQQTSQHRGPGTTIIHETFAIGRFFLVPSGNLLTEDARASARIGQIVIGSVGHIDTKDKVNVGLLKVKTPMSGSRDTYIIKHVVWEDGVITGSYYPRINGVTGEKAGEIAIRRIEIDTKRIFFLGSMTGELEGNVIVSVPHKQNPLTSAEEERLLTDARESGLCTNNDSSRVCVLRASIAKADKDIKSYQHVINELEKNLKQAKHEIALLKEKVHVPQSVLDASGPSQVGGVPGTV